MDLEQLTKHQILLLTLLVSFVTSIATGIVTVSLMDQAPAGVTRVINQVVERTVETVVPATQGAAVVTTEKTVVVKQDELVPESIAKVQKAIIRITVAGSDQLLARGIILNAEGLAVTDSKALAASGAKEFDAILSSGERVKATLRTSAGSTTALATVELAVGTSTGFAPAVLIDASKLTLGQSVIRIGGGGPDTVGEGVIATLPEGAEERVVQASVSSATPGSVLFTIFGEVVGLTTTGSGDMYTIVKMPAVPAEPVTNPSASS